MAQLPNDADDGNANGVLPPHVGSSQGWRSRLREVYLNLLGPMPSPSDPSWNVSREQGAALEIRWPTQYQWRGAHQWMDPLIAGLGRLVKVRPAAIAQPYQGVVLVEFAWNGTARAVAIDYSDAMDRVESNLFGKVAVYFKMQFRQGGYQRPEVVPGGYVNPTNAYYKYLSWLRSVRDRQPSAFDVYGRFGLKFAKEIRQRAVQILNAQDQFRYEGSAAIVRYFRSLDEAARSRICIDLPGNGDFCFRLMDYLGIGACVVAARHRTALHVPLEDRKHIVYVKDDLSDLVALCRYYLEHDREREQIARNGREFFDQFLHRDQLARYYLAKFFAKIKDQR